MSRFLVDALFIILILILGVSLLYNDDSPSETTNGNTDNPIDENTSANNPITDGEDDSLGLGDYDSNLFARGLYYLSDGVSSSVNYSFEIVINGIKKLLG